MNQKRRKDIGKARALLEEAREIIDTAYDEELRYKDEMPESFQYGEKGMAADEAINSLEEAAQSCDEATEALNNIQ